MSQAFSLTHLKGRLNEFENNRCAAYYVFTVTLSLPRSNILIEDQKFMINVQSISVCRHAPSYSVSGRFLFALIRAESFSSLTKVSLALCVCVCVCVRVHVWPSM